VSLINAIRLFKAKYLVCSFFRDLPSIREKTFIVLTIKYAFQNAGIWLVSFKAIKRKLKEYGKKSKKDTSLHILKFKSKLELKVKDDIIAMLIVDLILTQEY
jgi:hypothetical protein